MARRARKPGTIPTVALSTIVLDVGKNSEARVAVAAAWIDWDLAADGPWGTASLGDHDLSWDAARLGDIPGLTHLMAGGVRHLPVTDLLGHGASRVRHLLGPLLTGVAARRVGYLTADGLAGPAASGVRHLLGPAFPSVSTGRVRHLLGTGLTGPATGCIRNLL